jgi:hypothetical protein
MRISKLIKTGVMLLALSVGASTVFADVQAHPSNFTTRNYTKYQSNAKIKNVWSPFATPAGTATTPSERSVPWIGLKLLCGLVAKTCAAEIYMKTDTDTPVFVGQGTLDISTGDITPKELINNGFILTSPEPGVLEIREEETADLK